MKKLLPLLLLFSSCVDYSKDAVELAEDIQEYESPERSIVNYRQSFDVLRHIETDLFNPLLIDYYPECGFDSSYALADFNLDGILDVALAPNCTDTPGERQPPVAIFLGTDLGTYEKYEINIKNNIGVLPGVRQTILGDYNNDDIPDVMFVSHDGHGGDGGYASFLLSSEDEFEYIELTDMDRKWYSYGASGDLDNDGDLDMLVGGGADALIINNLTNFDIRTKYIQNFPHTSALGFVNIYDVNGDNWNDIIFNLYDESYVIFNDRGIFDYTNKKSIPVPEIEGNADIRDRIFVDFDSDGDIDIITVSDPHMTVETFYSYIQFVENSDNGFIDVTSKYFDHPYQYDTYVRWLVANDIDGDGKLDIYQRELTEEWFAIEWDGNKFR